MKMELREFVEEVKEELLCYEDMTQEQVKNWEEGFADWAKRTKRIRDEKGKRYLTIRDESEIFEIADSYYDAIQDGTLKRYWESFDMFHDSRWF